MIMEEEITTKKTIKKIEPIIEKLTKVDREATKFDFNSLPNSSDCESGLSYATDDLISNIINYDLNQYYSARIRPRKSFFKTIPFETYMKYDANEVLKTSLIQLPEELENASLELYNILRKYMGDKNTKKASYELVKKHLSICIASTIDLKDEAYVQVLKQLKDNIDK